MRRRPAGAARLGADAPPRARSCSIRSTATISMSTPRSARSRSPTASASRSPRRCRQDASVLIMDEPTAALAEADVQQLMAVVKRLRERGVGIVYVSHKLPEIFALADRVTVLRDGALIGTQADRRGRPRQTLVVDDGRPRRSTSCSPRSSRRSARPCSRCATSPSAAGCATSPSTLRRGEILGVAGLVGSGRTELALTIFGITPATSGDDRDRRQAGRRSPVAEAGAQSRHRLCAGGPRPAGPGPAADHRARTSRWPSLRQASRAASSSIAGKEAQRAARRDQAARHPRPRPGAGRSASSRAATSRRSCSASGSRPSRAS